MNKFEILGIKVEVDTTVFEEMLKRNIDVVSETANAVVNDLIANVEKDLAEFKTKHKPK